MGAEALSMYPRDTRDPRRRHGQICSLASMLTMLTLAATHSETIPRWIRQITLGTNPRPTQKSSAVNDKWKKP